MHALHDDTHVAYNRNLTLELFKQSVSLIVITRSKMAIPTEYALVDFLKSQFYIPLM